MFRRPRLKQGWGGSYQRLEFLGDHVLGLAVSDTRSPGSG